MRPLFSQQRLIFEFRASDWMTVVIKSVWSRSLLLLLLLPLLPQPPLPLPLPRVKMRALVKQINKFTTNKGCTVYILSLIRLQNLFSLVLKLRKIDRCV